MCSIGIVLIKDKMKKNRQRWSGNVVSRKETKSVRVWLSELNVEGRREKLKNKWLDTIERAE